MVMVPGKGNIQEGGFLAVVFLLLSPFLSLLEQWDAWGYCGVQGRGDKAAVLQCPWWAVTRLG